MIQVIRKLKTSIIDSLERANLKNTVYFRLRLHEPPTLSHREVMNLYNQFVQHNVDYFDFNEMKLSIKAQVGTYLAVNVNDIIDIPGCLLVFLPAPN